MNSKIVEYKGVLSSSTLHIIAMSAMLFDHMGYVIFPQLMWMRIIGRLAFPIYCFMLAEGFRHTSSAANYLKRLLIFGLISEIPFDLAFFGSNFRWDHQNVYWNLSISLVTLICLKKLEKPGVKYKIFQVFVVLAGFALATVLLTDYYGFGVLMVCVFYNHPGRNKKEWALQFLLIALINCVLLGSGSTRLGGITIPIGPQAFAIFALPLIWLYSGERGITAKPFKYFCYAFYPVHLLILGILNMFVL